MIVTIACVCPPKGDDVRHPDGDEITLRDRLDFRTTVTMQKSVISLRAETDDPSTAEILAVLSEAYLLYGVESWTLADARGKALPVSRSAIETYLLSNVPAALAVADVADDLYQETVLLPLLVKGSTSSATSPTTASTSPETGSQPAPLRPSKRSSTSTTRTAAIGTTSSSPDGDSSSSQNSASAA